MEHVVFRPEADAGELVGRMVTDFLRRSVDARRLGEALMTVGTRFGDGLDALAVPGDDELRRQLAASGFERVRSADGQELWEHPRALFPLLELGSSKARAVVKVESVVDFLEASGLDRRHEIEGVPWALARRVRIAEGADSELFVAERRDARVHVVARGTPQVGPGATAIARHLEAFRLRPRPFEAAEQGFDAALELARAATRELGSALASEVFFEAERRYYERKNRAARLQKARQDALGFGWFNRDHHTYRSSRGHFRALVAVLEALGLRCRERFYAGRDAGWGAQVMEHPETGSCVFADVDLSAEEITGDFPHEGLAPRATVGTVGLWCELHGEAFLAAGMHHLECQFDIDAITAQFREHGVGVMKRFTDYPHLKQAFTDGEVWSVPHARLERAERAGFVNHAQVERLGREGALGSHFEVLERNAGYKGFNQDGINRIILATDPRYAAEVALQP